MAKDGDFKDYILDQLSGFEGVQERQMFGGWGLYRKNSFFGIISEGRLYFKTNEKTAEKYKKVGMKQFSPTPKMTLKTYYEVPPDVVENSEDLIKWAKESINVLH
jgi:DNA transformation protein